MKDKQANKKAHEKEKDDLETLKAQVKVLREELDTKDDYYDKFLRLQADFDNFRKRSARDREDFVKFANEGLILELVSIVDDFERGVRSAEQKKDFDLLHQGVDMILKQLHRLLEEKGLTRIECLGKKFDPLLHDAIEVAEGEEGDEGSIVEELQPGYKFNGRVIRPAKVKVVKESTEHREQSTEGEG